MLIEPHLSDENKKHLRDIAVPALAAGLSTLLQELAKWAVGELRERMKPPKKEEPKKE